MTTAIKKLETLETFTEITALVDLYVLDEDAYKSIIEKLDSIDHLINTAIDEYYEKEAEVKEIEALVQNVYLDYVQKRDITNSLRVLFDSVLGRII